MSHASRLSRDNGEMMTKAESRCNRKKRYISFQAALNEARYLRGATGENIWPYLCDFCTKYHNGTRRGAKHEK